jgi:hypothetical protein
MIYAKASKPSERTPCTNIPLTCPMCSRDRHGHQPTFWKYNFIFHMSEKHVIRSTDGNHHEEIFAPLHPELVVTTRISRFEEEKIEIPSTYTDTWRKINNVPDSDIIEAPAGFEGRDSRKRGSSDVSQASTVSRQPSPSKKYR